MAQINPDRVALLTGLTASHGRGLLRGVREYVRRHTGWGLDVYDRTSALQPLLAQGLYRGVMGQIIGRDFASVLTALRVPAVTTSNARLDLPLPKVCSDDVAVGRLGAEHFLASGFRNLSYCGFGEAEGRFGFSRLRGTGFRERLELAGVPCRVFTDELRGQDELAWIGEWLKSLPRPVGVMAANDTRARHVLDAAIRSKLRVPEEIAIVGVDNDEIECEMTPLPLSSVAVDFPRIGFEAARLLHRLIQGEASPSGPIVVPPLEVVTRRSSESLAIADAEVATAIRFIRANSHRPLEVEEVAEAAMISRRALERRFRAALGSTPHEEVRRCQFHRARQLLATTSLSMSEIAQAAGFRDAKIFGMLFRKATGLAPREYRRQYRTHVS